MSGPADRERLVGDWLVKADEDLLAAEHLLVLKDARVFGAICFHAQQCVEKSVKALLVSLSMPFPKVHDIRELLDLLPAERRPTLGLLLQERLTDYATVGRYPGEEGPVTREETEQAVGAARDVRQQVRRMLPT